MTDAEREPGQEVAAAVKSPSRLKRTLAEAEERSGGGAARCSRNYARWRG